MCLALVLLIVDYMTRARIESSAREMLSEVSLQILGQGDASLLFERLEGGVQPTNLGDSFIYRYLPLIAMDPWEGQIDVPPLYASGMPSAELTARARYSRGVADVHAKLIYRDGAWLIREYEVIQGPAAQ